MGTLPHSKLEIKPQSASVEGEKQRLQRMGYRDPIQKGKWPDTRQHCNRYGDEE